MDEEGVSAIKTLDDIGIAEIRLRDTLLRATNATELFSKTQATANKAWDKNTALTEEANKRYDTTKSRLTNLKNTALMFARQIGDDLNPTIQKLIDKANDLLQKFLSLDKGQRESIVKWAAFAAAVGPVVLVLGKVVGAVGTVTGALGKAFTALGGFSAKVSMAGGGLGGLVKTLASSKLAMVALSAALVYVVATHIDKHHIHNHIIICSTDLEGQHKYRDVKQSAKDLAEISDSLCREHGLSVIQNPQDKTVTYDKWQGNQRRFTHRDELRMIIDAALRMQPDGFDALMQLLEDAGCRIKRGAQISIKPPEGKRYIRLDTLGSEYDETSLRRTLARDHVHIPKIPRGDFNGSQVKRLIDIETKLHAGKGKGFQVWLQDLQHL